MKNRATATIILSIISIFGGIILNFQEFLMGSHANLRNFIVTFAYIVIWILVLRMGAKSNNRGIMKYFSIFWTTTLFFILLTVYVNVTGISADWAIPFVVLLLGQWYGIRFLFGSIFTTLIVMAFISLAMSIISVVLLKRTR